MTKSELVLRLSKKYPHLYQRDIETLVNNIFDDISTTLIDGGRVELRGFGALPRFANAKHAKPGTQRTARKFASANVLPFTSAPAKSYASGSIKHP